MANNKNKKQTKVAKSNKPASKVVVVKVKKPAPTKKGSAPQQKVATKKPQVKFDKNKNAKLDKNKKTDKTAHSKKAAAPQLQPIPVKGKVIISKQGKTDSKPAPAQKAVKPVAPATVEDKAAHKKDTKAQKADKKAKKKETPDLDEEFLLDEVGDDTELLGLEDELKAIEAEDEEELSIDIEVESEDVGFERKDDEVILTDAEGRRYCRVKDCDQAAVVDTYCRYHYLLFWKKIQVRKKILADGKLARYVEELTSRYPDKFLEMLRKDIKTEKDFLNAIQELEIDESASDSDFEEETQSYIDEVRGTSDTGAAADDDDF